jgi:hypothetical protein
LFSKAESLIEFNLGQRPGEEGPVWIRSALKGQVLSVHKSCNCTKIHIPFGYSFIVQVLTLPSGLASFKSANNCIKNILSLRNPDLKGSDLIKKDQNLYIKYCLE